MPESEIERKTRNAKYQRDWRKKNKKKYEIQHRKDSLNYYRKNSKKINKKNSKDPIVILKRKLKANEKSVYDKIYNVKNEVNKFKWNIMRTYGMTLVDYDKLLKKQKDKCAICKIIRKTGSKRFAVDHNHKTGKNRGLLCSRCNFGLGYFLDDCKILKTAIKYLEKHT